MTKWKHTVVFTYKHGRVKAQCQGTECGWQTKWLTDLELARQLGRDHTGLAERQNLGPAAH